MNKYFIFYYFCHCRVAELVWVTSSVELTINFESSNFINICLAEEYSSFKVILESSLNLFVFYIAVRVDQKMK